MAYDLILNRLDHDLVFQEISNGKQELAIFDTADRVAQQVKINLLAFLGEWFLDVTFGVPYLEEILVKNPRIAVIESIIREHINSIPNLRRITSLGMDWDRRMRGLFVSFSAETDLGPIKNSFSLELNRNV